MTRQTRIIKVSPTDAKLDGMTRIDLIALLGVIPGASIPALHRADAGALRSAARTYLRIGRLAEAQVLQFKTEGKA
jgi:hypothetical protein